MDPHGDFGDYTAPEAHDKIPAEDTPQLSENVYAESIPVLQEADSMHETMVKLMRQNSALVARLERYERPADEAAPHPGGLPVKHHLHLVDGRTIANHEGIGTHYSETLPDGTTLVTRVKAYYPANEPDPSTLYA